MTLNRRLLRRPVALVAAAAALATLWLASRGTADLRIHDTDWTPIGPPLACLTSPTFVERLGFSPESALSTGEVDMSGLVLIDAADPPRVYQHPSWSQFGNLGPIAYDRSGNLFVAPAPGVDLDDIPSEPRNMLLSVDTDTGEMSLFTRLPTDGAPSPQNPFGVLDLAYDCDTDSLYASSVAGSTRRVESGHVFHVDASSGTTTGSLPDVDAIGLAVLRFDSGRRLYFGSARVPEVRSIGLDSRGGFAGPPRFEFALPEASAKAHRLAFQSATTLEVLAARFDFNLVPASHSDRVSHAYQLDPATGTWSYVASTLRLGSR